MFCSILSKHPSRHNYVRNFRRIDPNIFPPLHPLGVGIALFAVPKLMIGKYDGMSGTGGFNPTCQASGGPQGDVQCNGDEGGTIGHMAVFMISQLLMGIGTTPLYTLGNFIFESPASSLMANI